MEGVEGKRKQSWSLKWGSRGVGWKGGLSGSQWGHSVGGRARESRVTFACALSTVNTFSGRQKAVLTARRWRRGDRT